MRNKSAQRVAVSGLLTSLMLVLGLIERQFPLTAAIPGIKLGLANSVLIYALYMLGIKQSVVLMLLKALMSWLIYTNMQAMFYSLAGGALSLLAMIALSRIKGVSVIGVSALGAVAFNVGQILMAVVMLNTPQLIVTYLPVLMVSGVVTGVLTIAAIGVAAHECGHAVQHARNYVPLSVRSAIVPVANFGSQLSWPLFLAGLIFSFRPLLMIGILLFCAALLFQIVTLPVEFNASARALRMLDETGIMGKQEIRGTKKVLRAAAMTYVAAVIGSLLQLLILLILSGAFRRRDD